MLIEALKSRIPPAFMAGYYNAVGRSRLGKIGRLPFNDSNLRTLSAGEIAATFTDEDITNAWTEDSAVISSRFGEGHYGLGVNPGDRRAIYSVILQLKPRKILEIGTHLGASTIHIAAALKRLGASGKLATLDIDDANAKDGPWHQFGMPRSPFDYLREMGLDGFVSFIKSDSIAYLSSAQEAYDFIFLDGDHCAATVYQELSLSLPLLSAGGVVMLHDYFPDGRPLFPGLAPDQGPFRALLRVQNENPSIRVFPFGALPWPTKNGTNMTSLAIVGRDLQA
jgi:predicted O-methyltransferase YrrM